MITRHTDEHATVLAVSWGYDVYVELRVSQIDWARIIEGDNVTIKGEGYGYEGEIFIDFWDFSGGLDGQLEVRYGSTEDGDFSGQGFIGRTKDAVVDVEE